ncbi:MAG: aspartate-semialdehyde dehydrogenase [Anaerolineales bacterium]|nr:aspartate-semialdehyde dehydrogenase [Anaerolineales bacterium]
MRRKIPAVILGAAGAVGQRFVQLLDHHPWFEVVALTGSERGAGRTYEEACHWVLDIPMPEWARRMEVLPTLPKAVDAPLVFSALPAHAAREAEPIYAQAGSIVCSNASAFREEADVPLILPEVNPDHTCLIHRQRRERGWSGGIVTNPNCTSTGMTVTLKALKDAFGVEKVVAVSMQALSGAGYPGVASLDILGNVIPYIPGEEEKVESEPLKMLGDLQGEAILAAPLTISAHTNRVAVADGHTLCLSIALNRPPSDMQEIARCLADYAAPQISRDLPSAPQPPIRVLEAPDRPQPRLDVHTGAGMTTVVGRVRPDPIFDVKMTVLSHNTIRGAAGASIYNAELLVKQGIITDEWS